MRFYKKKNDLADVHNLVQHWMYSESPVHTGNNLKYLGTIVYYIFVLSQAGNEKKLHLTLMKSSR